MNIDDYLQKYTPPTHVKFDFQKGDTFIRVFELPENITKQFCFNGGHSIQFRLVDWFRANEIFDDNGNYPSETIKDLKEFIRMKAYFNSKRFYIVICSNGECFLVNDI